jgi:hypothetical protein
MPNARGGSRRQPVPLVEVGALQQAFEELVRKMGEKVFDFGVYRSLARAQAANAHGLAANEQAIGTLSCLAPDGYLQFAQLKHALQGFACYNDTPFKADIWAGCVAERLLTLLCHWRRVSREPERLKQCLSKASKEDQAAVKRLVKLYQEPSSSEAPSKKTLQRERTDSSSVTLDSQGFPRMLRELGDDSCTDDEEKEEAEGEGEEELQECSQETPRAKPRGAAPQEPCGRLLRKGPAEDERSKFLESLRAAAHEAAGDVAQMRDVANKRVHKTIMKKPSQQGKARPSMPLGRTGAAGAAAPKGWTRVLATYATDQSYLRCVYKGDSKPRLLVACSRAMAERTDKQHQDIIKALLGPAQQAGATKEELIKQRDQLLQG